MMTKQAGTPGNRHVSKQTNTQTDRQTNHSCKQKEDKSRKADEPNDEDEKQK